MRVGVVLAAGASRRMGRPKPLVQIAGQTFLVRSVRRLWGACDAVVVVLGSAAHEVQRSIEREFERIVASSRVSRDLKSRHRARRLEARFLVHARWRRGMLSSVQAGLSAALELRAHAILVMPVDQPSVRPATVGAVAGAMEAALAAYRGGGAKRSRFAYALIPRHRRRRGHPIAVSAALARAIAIDRGATDLSDAVRRNARLIGYLDVTDPGVVQNRNRG
ncbi:MAG: hypothetical protein E6K78_11720 [Candidatus Eisenbacteria bacterium]|uniref:MobA-like NTP transferase domain-containing protein n=1 Tax=Eiseniibacteriota bacterium TaxID=2212470 RepID=A0A538TFU1_UNCEI|nr:MAG: hypothetical protein E6K78_11720 [Candidatus Eisenbacteria bacterium]